MTSLGVDSAQVSCGRSPAKFPALAIRQFFITEILSKFGSDLCGDTFLPNTKTHRQTCATDANNTSDLRNTEEALLQSFFMLAVRTYVEIVVVAFGANEPIMENGELACVVIFLTPLSL